MSKADKRLIFEALGLGIVVFGWLWCWRKPGGPWTRRPAFLLSGFCLAFVIMQTSLVRSDHGHVLFSIFPMVFLSGLVVMDEPQFGTALSVVLPGVAIAATLALAHPYPMFLPKEVESRLSQAREPLVTCPPGLQEFDRACLSAGAAQLFSSVSVSVHLHTAPGVQIALFPYETAFGLASRHQVAGGLLQSYLANGPYLTGLDLVGLQQSSARFELYFPDGIISVPIDGVPSFTRSPMCGFIFCAITVQKARLRPGCLD